MATNPVLRPLDEGRARAVAGDVTAAQRRRLLAAMVAAVAEKGYVAVAVSDVVARARVSRATFYEQFADKNDCFLAAFRACAENLTTTVRDGVTGDLTPRQRVRATFDSYLGGLAAFPEGARMCLVEVHAAGPTAAEARREIQQPFAALLRTLHDGLGAAGEPVRPLGDFDYEALVGAFSSIVTNRVAAGATAELPQLAIRFESFLLTHFGLDPTD
ncbi:MAG TPA: TetR/AcrR family transcriptional regulator [Acidimicrobiales bacterium]|nr:TetR/AcrR family transcriptional regulator [Acidimicrobiales bacterium]